ncbi:MAG: hypothetical protein K9L68_09270 [Spirochaetales bacterium]|nr:hypothetical protein [Spirochaetales bacterium]MCF7938775.1 hypothetical protein [Spirochaetales bacterium]
MVATPKLIQEVRENNRRVKINDELEALILEQLGSEPYPHTYSEQDIHEQMRKIIREYNVSHGIEGGY